MTLLRATDRSCSLYATARDEDITSCSGHAPPEGRCQGNDNVHQMLQTRVNRELTLTWHIHHHIDIDFHVIGRIPIHAELVVWPTPYVLAEVIEHEQKGDERNKEGEKSSRFRASFVGRW